VAAEAELPALALVVVVECSKGVAEERALLLLCLPVEAFRARPAAA
jgi:hypothetical protein